MKHPAFLSDSARPGFRVASGLFASLFFFSPVALHAGLLIPSDGANMDAFGIGADLSGQGAIFGAPHVSGAGSVWFGAAYYFHAVDFNESLTVQTTILHASDTALRDQFGHGVALSGGNALVGSPYNDGAATDQGAAYYYRDVDQSSGTMQETLKLTVSDPAEGDDLGYYVSLYGDDAILTSHSNYAAYYHGINSFTESSANYDSEAGAYTQTFKLVASDYAEDDNFGISVSIVGTNAIVGAFGASVERDGATYVAAGKAYYYNLAKAPAGAATVPESVILTISDGIVEGAMLGRSASLYGDNALVGAYGVKVGENAFQGAAYYYPHLSALSGNSATETVKLVSSDGLGYDRFGGSVSLDNGNALVGAYQATVNETYYSGAAYYFTGLDSATGTLTETLKIVALGETEALFGYAVCLEGDDFFITAEFGHNPLTSVPSGNAYTGTISSLTTLDSFAGATRVIEGISFRSEEDWIIGATLPGNTVTLAGGSEADVTAPGRAVIVGSAEGGDGNTLRIDGFLKAGSVRVGCGNLNGGNMIEVGRDALVIADSLTVSAAPAGAAANVVRIYPRSLLALGGNGAEEIEDLIAKGRIILRYGDRYIPATMDLVDYCYCPDEDSAKAFLADEGLTAQAAHADQLGGFVLIASRIPSLEWANPQTGEGSWFRSSWYGWLYCDVEDSGWIWHPVHGWQYAVDQGGAVCLWDSATKSWWYTSEESYPNFYNYAVGAWYAYISGNSPNRVFWNYADGVYVNEPSSPFGAIR